MTVREAPDAESLAQTLAELMQEVKACRADLAQFAGRVEPLLQMAERWTRSTWLPWKTKS